MDRQRWLADCFARGMRLATHEKNHAYAHEMFAECVVLDPGNLKFVEAMMANLRAKSAGAGRTVKTRGPGFWAARAMRRAAAKKNWPEVLRAGVKLLGANPRHVPTLRAMARACETLHYNEVELVYLKQALDANPKDIESNRHCAVSLARMGQFDQAMACWHRIEEITGGNREAAQMILKLAEEKIKYPGGKPPAKRKTEAEVQKPPETQAAEACGEQHPPAEADPLLAVNASDSARDIERAAQEGASKRASHEPAKSESSAESQPRRAKRVFRMPWLELALVGAVVALLLQIFPSWWDTVAAFAVEHLQILLILANAVVVVVLIMLKRIADR